MKIADILKKFNDIAGNRPPLLNETNIIVRKVSEKLTLETGVVKNDIFSVPKKFKNKVIELMSPRVLEAHGGYKYGVHMVGGNRSPVVWELLKNLLKGKRINVVTACNVEGRIPILVRLGLLGKVYYPKSTVYGLSDIATLNGNLILGNTLGATGWYVSPNTLPLLAFAAPLVGGYGLGKIGGLAFKAAADAFDKASQTAEHIRALEFGGTLGAGYMSQEAATERQRGVSANNRSEHGGRRGLMLEAQNYAALV